MPKNLLKLNFDKSIAKKLGKNINCHIENSKFFKQFKKKFVILANVIYTTLFLSNLYLSRLDYIDLTYTLLTYTLLTYTTLTYTILTYTTLTYTILWIQTVSTLDPT
jgi:hypothetical protein